MNQNLGMTWNFEEEILKYTIYTKGNDFIHIIKFQYYEGP